MSTMRKRKERNRRIINVSKSNTTRFTNVTSRIVKTQDNSEVYDVESEIQSIKPINYRIV